MASNQKKNSFSKKKGQTSVEFLAVVGIAMLMIVPATALFMSHTRTSTDQIISEQMNNIGNRIMGKAEEMYIAGQDSWATITVNFPEALTETEISGNRELFFTYDSHKGPTQAVFFSTRFNITTEGTSCQPACTLNFIPGRNDIRIRSAGKEVIITRVN